MANNRRYAPTDLPTALMRLVQNTLANAAAKVHTHSASDIISGTLPVERGGTGQTTLAGILSAINAAPADHVHSATTDITSGTLPVARGGTGLGSATENGVLLGGGSSNFKVVASTPGALYATANGGIPTFGTLPVAEGGTGGATPATARTNLDVYSKSEVNNLIPEIPASAGVYFAECASEASAQNKTATVTAPSGFALSVGVIVYVKFSATNTYSATADAPITLNVNNTGAKNIYGANSATPTGTNTTLFGRANYVNSYVYDGTHWVWSGSSTDNNTTYSAITQAQITAGTATSARSISAKVAHDAIRDLAGGTLAVNRGGTGGTTPATARTNLDVYSKAEVDAKVTSLDAMTQAEADAGTSTDQRSISPSVLSTSIGTKLEAWTPRGIFISDVDYGALTEAEKKNGAVYYVYTVGPPSHDSAAEWAANPADLKVAGDDIAANGTSSAYYAEFAQYMADDADFTVAIENASSYTSVAADQVIQYRLVDIARADAAGTVHGLWFQAKKSLPKAYAMNTSTSTTGGWPSMNLRTIMNSGEVWNMHPSALRDVMATVTNTSRGPSGQVTSQDKLFIASFAELRPGSINSNDGPQFTYWVDKGVTSGNYAPLANMDTTNSGAAPSGRSYEYWWNRSIIAGGDGSKFAPVSSNGDWNGASPTYAFGVVPCFSI